ncbi:Ppx/GppA family phosphatase [Chlorobium phaeovibrioides]|uniref:Ppx/GppA family phosphatase n=1 Tax=Chlorobium phaeovibrioides TaxID=1094 RepID=A0A432AWT5_CHLPH|nr:Ppx/GppA phosphatase family protein [Chlorobium phaeovibrioides]MWV54231.1 Ppx/GppA family phosphatase [Chlorobium phaeovibrioides]QEQ56343.1 Ppx/GppA family phosphatase [Chlorobium phaeovibrioides]RTY36647.1 Ppx/GppA family phosphatase [Chlorobium phaeovibrioides]RTY39432.1 Ppx/GppA family phosphatase [Chlorobium phaeovibrioides]
MERVSCIDIGTNTALLLIVDIDPLKGTIEPVYHKQAIVRLGQQVDELKIIDREAKERLINCLLDFKKISDDEGADTIIATGTSALRDAKNRMEVTSELVRSTGIVVRCISGEEEAELTFFGAVSGMGNIPDPFTVTDIGGGSTEISMGSTGGITQSVSLDIGSVRLTERFFHSLPPAPEEYTMAKEEINRVLTGAVLPFFASREQVYGVAGTITAIAQIVQGDREFDVTKVHNYLLSYNDVHNLLERLKEMKLEEITALGIPEGRADVITMGTLILHQFMRLLGIGEIRVSAQGLRYGLALKELLRLQGEG